MAYALKPHQQTGIDALLQHPRYLLADDMGLGKTLQAIRAGEELEVPGHRFVVAPANACGVWLKELAREEVSSVCWIKSAKTAILKAKWIVVSYDIFRRTEKTILKALGPIGVLILDECQKIKDIKSKTNAAVTPLAMRVPYFWALSGTPIKNHYGEFFAQARLLVPFSTLRRHGVDGFYHWRDRFCEVEDEIIHVFDRKLRQVVARKVQRIVDSKDPQGIKDILGPYLLRRTKKQVLKDLPDLLWQQLHVDDISVPFDEDELVEMELAAKAGRAPRLHIATRRALWAMAAVPHAQSIIVDHVEDDGTPMLVFCSHIEPIAALEATLRQEGIRVAVITGAVPPATRSRIETDFQAGLYDVLIGQTLAAGTALTLTRAKRVLFIDLAWSPADNAQARDRAHRIGQDEVVLAQYLTSDDPLSERVTSILATKTAALAALEMAT